MGRAAIVFALVVLAVATARADDLDTARKAVDSSDYVAARTALAKALAAGTASPSDLADIYKLTGIVEAALGDANAARSAFQKWLSLDPKGTLPDGTSPKITRPFAAASGVATPVKVKVETSADPPQITLVVQTDREDLITGARVFVRADGGPEKQLDGTGADKIKIDLPHGQRLDLRVQALDSHGNRVVELGSSDVPIVITGASTEPVATTTTTTTRKVVPHEPATPRPVLLRWWLWGTAAVVFAGAGTYFGVTAVHDRNELDTIEANSSTHMFSDASSLETRIRRELIAFDVGLGVGGAFALGAVILYATRPHLEQRIAVVPAPGGGSVVFGGSF
jgi:hypothetical protein